MTTFPSAASSPLIEQLMTLYHHEVNHREAERKQIASYLNDTAVQTLSALHIHFSLLHTAPEAQMRRDLANTLPLIVDLMADLARLARQLRPLELDTIGLHEALQLAVEEFATPQAIRYEGSSTAPLPTEVTTAFYQLVQEWLKSAQPHSQTADISMQLATEGTAVRLTIEDHTAGLPALPRGELDTLQLLGHQVRFQRLKGQVTQYTLPNGGTAITAVWPWLEPASQNTSGGNPVQHEPG